MRSMDPGYPKPITIWKGIPESPQGAFVHKENGMQTHSYFNDLLTLTKKEFLIYEQNISCYRTCSCDDGCLFACII